MRIRIEVKTTAFRYIWMKYVTGFASQYHCAKCLIGKRSEIVPPLVGPRLACVYEGELNEYEAPCIYLCGGTGRYEQNIHIAFQADDRSSVEYEDANISVSISGARRLEIMPLPEEIRLPKAFITCRNFQFGYHYFRLSGEGKEHE